MLYVEENGFQQNICGAIANEILTTVRTNYATILTVPNLIAELSTELEPIPEVIIFLEHLIMDLLILSIPASNKTDLVASQISAQILIPKAMIGRMEIYIINPVVITSTPSKIIIIPHATLILIRDLETKIKLILVVC
jgi:hypothetical protein